MNFNLLLLVVCHVISHCWNKKTNVAKKIKWGHKSLFLKRPRIMVQTGKCCFTHNTEKFLEKLLTPIKNSGFILLSITWTFIMPRNFRYLNFEEAQLPNGLGFLRIQCEYFYATKLFDSVLILFKIGQYILTPTF